ncbi:MAG TPA: ParB/RepB/Spo0J family partition protein [Terriglobia bacterium]|nr:ParB/RepB/Spo0J family partition protein [Terriglobia bacterium]
MTRKALGRGLSALLQEVETPPGGAEEIDLELIDPNPLQPRRDFPEATLKELTDSIRASGVVQPVLLRRADARYQLVAGERRWRAARLAGLKSIPAVVRELNDRDTLELALTENLQREDLNPIEVAHGYEALQTKFNLTHEEIAARIGSNRSTVTNTLRLLRLPLEVQNLVASAGLSSGHARALLSLDSAASQVHLAQLIVKRGLSVRQVEAMVEGEGNAETSSKAESKPKEVDPNTKAAILEMERSLGTRVRIVGDEQRGRIEISYFSSDDLNRIYAHIVRQ